MRSMLRRPSREVLALLLCGWLAALAGCDNPACAFSANGCFEGGAGGGPGGGQIGGEAQVPFDGARLRDGQPQIEEVLPSGSNVDGRTPIAIRFSESMNAGSLAGAFRVVLSSEIGSTPIPAGQVLVGDGRLLLLFPPPGQDWGENANIRVVFQDENEVRDLTGQPLDATPESLVGEFVTAASPVSTPSLVTTWPPAGTNDVHERTEIIAVFDRAMESGPFGQGGFEVTIDGDPPVPDPTPSPLSAGQLGGTPIVDQRVWVYRRVQGASDVLLPLPSDATVALQLSVGTSLVDSDGGELAPQTLSFSTPAVASPLSVAIASQPDDAIGIANLDPGPSEFTLEVELAAAAAGDQLSVFAFGNSLGDDPVLAATQRNLTLDDGQTSVTLSLEETPLLLDGQAGQAVYADGDVFLGVRQRRGGIVTSIRMLDLDPVVDGVQGAVLDTVPPTLVDLDLPGGGFDRFLSDLRDLTLTGRASEELRAVNVAVVDLPGAMGVLTNADGFADPAPDFVPVIGSRPDGGFIAAPVAIGLVDPVVDGGGSTVPELTYSFTIYDRALNASQEFAGVHTQVGTVGGAPLATDGVFTVEVVDRSTLGPIAGAVVVVGDVTVPSTGLNAPARAFTTDADGRAVIPAPPTPYAGDVVVTVDADGYDLFTLHGLTTQWLGVPLDRFDFEATTVAGIVEAQSADAQGLLASDDIELRLADSRRLGDSSGTFEEESCTPGNPLFGTLPFCQYGPQPIRPGRIGGQSVFLGNLDGGFGNSGMLEAYRLNLPVTAPTPGSLTVVDTLVSSTLDDVGDDPQVVGEDLSISLLSGQTGALGTIVDADGGAFAGDPSVWIEARLPGLDRPVTVGVGRAGGATNQSWPVQAYFDPSLAERLDAALPDPLPEPDPEPGDTFTPGQIDASDGILHLVLSLVDADGDRSVVRPRLSQLVTLDLNLTPDALVPPLVPALSQPFEGGTPTLDAGGNFELRHLDSLFDVFAGIYAVDGLFGIRLTDADGRSWNLYRADQPNASSGEVRSLYALSSSDPMLAASGTGLAPGDLSARVRLWAWQSESLPDFEPAGADLFDPDRFAWSDLDLQPLLFAESRIYTFELPAPTGP